MAETREWHSISCASTDGRAGDDRPRRRHHHAQHRRGRLRRFARNMREKMGEAYRTVLGHLRHEIGHYYWDRLIRDSRPARRVSRRSSATTRRLRRRRVAAPLRAGRAGELVGLVHQRLRHHASLGGLGGDLGALPAHGRHARDRARATDSHCACPAPSVPANRCPPMRWHSAISNR